MRLPVIIRAAIMIENQPADPWHFPRDALAASVMDTLESGIVNAITLFASRRMGKTQFACTDLAPLAVRKGWLVAYCNLWDDKPNPAGAIVATLAAATEPFRSGARARWRSRPTWASSRPARKPRKRSRPAARPPTSWAGQVAPGPERAAAP